MTPRCPAGHASAARDYCDECGAPMTDVVEHDDTTSVTLVDRCPDCGHVRAAGDRYCERCGRDLAADTGPSAPPGWVATITADRHFHARLAPEGFAFPGDVPSRTVALDGDVILIGRSTPDGGAAPDIDLAHAPEDPAVSRRHAHLVRARDGSFELVDLRSTNGTWLNDDDHPVPPDVAVGLEPGDRVHVGAWTTITVTRAPLDT